MRLNVSILALLVLMVGATLPLAAQSAHALDVQALAKFNRGDFAGARQDLQKALQAAPNDAQTMILLGFADVWSQHPGQASQVWADAGRDGKWGTTANVLNGMLQWRQGSFMLAGNWFDFCRSDQPAYALCQNLKNQMNAGAAVPPLQQWTTLIGWMSNPKAPYTGPGLRQLDQQALQQIGQGDLMGAQKTLVQSLQMGPHDSITLTVIGLLYLKAGQFAKANDAWQKAASDPHWGNMADILHGLVDWKQNPSSWGVSWFDLCHSNESLASTCQSLSKQKSAHQPVPPSSQWLSLAGLGQGVPTVHVAALAAPPAPAAPAAGALANAGAANGANGSGQIRLDRSSYPAGSKIQVTYGGFSGVSTLELWFAPVGSAPKTNFSSFLFLHEGHGTVQMAAPTPGETYEVRYIVLEEPGAVVHHGPRFTMQAATMYASTPNGHYGCWFYFYPYGIWRSAIAWVEIDSATSYRDPRGYGNYIFDRPKALVHMTSGPLAGRVAHLHKDVHGRTELLFLFGENNPKSHRGTPTIDNGNTNCYLGQK